jgi:type II secretory pathway pseudopilin PulG
MKARLRIEGDRGETLLELIVAITILGVCVVAIASGIALSVKVSAIHRQQSTAGAYVRNYAEALETSVAAGGYAPCAGTASYPMYIPPAGYTASVTKVEYWTGVMWTTTGCVVSADDSGTQRLSLQVASSGNSPGNGAAEALVVVLRKQCSAAQPCS